MKFISGFIKHSLQPSRKLANVYSPAGSQPDLTPQAASAHEEINAADRTELAVNQPVTASSDHAVAAQTTDINNIAATSNSPLPAKRAAAVETETTDASSSNKSTLTASNDDPSPQRQHPLETENSSSKPALELRIETARENHSQPPKFKHEQLQNRVHEELVSNDLSQQNTSDKDSFSSVSSIVSKRQTAEAASPDKSLRTESSSKLSSTALPSASTLNVSSDLQYQDAESQTEEVSVAAPITEPVTTLSKVDNTATDSTRAETSYTAKPATTPQVRIANINILIDDQAAAKPPGKPASSPPGPSFTFGLRGL